MRALQLVVGVTQPPMNHVAGHRCSEKQLGHPYAQYIYARRPCTALGQQRQNHAGEAVHERGAVCNVYIGGGLRIFAKHHAAVFPHAGEHADQ